ALPTLAGRLERADQRIAIGRLMAAGSKFEGEGKRDAAVEAYRDALELDPSYLPAREALARLDVETPAVAGADELVLGMVQIDSRPAAKISIDGNPAGTTPFSGKLAVGKHEIRLTARGYYNYNVEIDVKSENNTPIAANLKGRSGSSKASKGSKGSADAESEPAETPPGETPKATKPSTGTSGKKASPFLPTKDDDGKKSSGPFLPTKD
ncbi:MAG: PEGA domain-containing protein, partial [Nannocystaceae bacterium]